MQREAGTRSRGKAPGFWLFLRPAYLYALGGPVRHPWFLLSHFHSIWGYSDWFLLQLGSRRAPWCCSLPSPRFSESVRVSSPELQENVHASPFSPGRLRFQFHGCHEVQFCGWRKKERGVEQPGFPTMHWALLPKPCSEHFTCIVSFAWLWISDWISVSQMKRLRLLRS